MRIDSSELLPGDILLSRGVSEVAAGIVDLDGGGYSHVALWSADEVIESTLPAARAAQLAECSKDALYIDAFRNLRQPLDRGAIIERARSFIGCRYGSTDLVLSTLLLAVSSWMPADWMEMATLYGVGRLDRMLRVLLAARPRESGTVTCAGLAVVAYRDAGAPLAVRLHAGRELNGATFLRALKALARRLLEGGHHARGIHGERMFVPLPLGQGDFADELRWILSLPDPELDSEPHPRPRGEDIARLRLFFLRELGVIELHAASERLGELSTESLSKLELRAGDNWSASLVTPRQLETSPDLLLVGRLHERVRHRS